MNKERAKNRMSQAFRAACGPKPVLYNTRHLDKVREMSEKWCTVYPPGKFKVVTVEELAKQLPEVIALLANFESTYISLSVNDGNIYIYTMKS
jgi:hypothetical protein